MTAQSGLGFAGIVAINIPDDGATGEVLTKLTPDNYDYDWAVGGGGGGQVDSVVGGVSITVDATDPVNPIVNLDITSVDLIYLRLDTANDPLTGELVVQDVVPTQPQARAVGLDGTRFNQMRGRLGMFVGESGATGNIIAPAGSIRISAGTAQAGLMICSPARMGSGATVPHLQGCTYKAVMTAGNVFSYSTGAARILNVGGGSLAMGSAFSYGAGNALINVTGPGSFTCAYAYTGYGGGAKNHTLLNSGIGSFLGGYSYAVGQS